MSHGVHLIDPHGVSDTASASLESVLDVALMAAVFSIPVTVCEESHPAGQTDLFVHVFRLISLRCLFHQVFLHLSGQNSFSFRSKYCITVTPHCLQNPCVILKSVGIPCFPGTNPFLRQNDLTVLLLIPALSAIWE